MKKEEISTRLSGTISKVGFTLKKHSPEILVISGVVGAVVSTVMACKATTKVSSISNAAKNDIASVHKWEAESSAEEYSKEDAKKDLTIIYVQTGVKYAKLYAPAAIVGVLSITSILTSHGIMKKRNLALAAAYSAIDKGFKEYRSRVVERFGEDVDRELKYNIKANRAEVTKTDENGKEKKSKETISVTDSVAGYSPYARFFDEACENWQKSSEYNLMFLRSQQQYANDLLRTRGHLFLNEVYDMLGIPRTKAGQVVGWKYDSEHPTGDNYVDFGIYETNREKTRDFVNGYERVILLDFNVDGDIWTSMN